MEVPEGNREPSDLPEGDYEEETQEVFEENPFHGPANREQLERDGLEERLVRALDLNSGRKPMADDRKVLFVKMKLKGIALQWWRRLEKQRIIRLPCIRSFIGSIKEKSVYDYTAEFNNLSMRVGLNETNEQLTVRYISGLKIAICDEMGIIRVSNLEDAYQYALRAEERGVRSDSTAVRGYKNATTIGRTTVRTIGNDEGVDKEIAKNSAIGRFGSNINRVDNRSTLHCYSCGERGHVLMLVLIGKSTLLKALQRTHEFEEELAEKFSGGTRNREIGSDIEEIDKVENNGQTVSDIRKKYEKKLAAHHGSGTEEKDGHKDLLTPGAGFNFHGIISSCFEPHLSVYVELEEKTLMENLEKLVQEETWDTEEGSQTNILSSSMQGSGSELVMLSAANVNTGHNPEIRDLLIFRNNAMYSITKPLPSPIGIFDNQEKLKEMQWFDKEPDIIKFDQVATDEPVEPKAAVPVVGKTAPRSDVFQRILRAYATKLFARLPKGGTGIVAAATGTDGQIKTSDRDERVICYIVNTAEYCHKTSGELAENVSKIIDSQFIDRVDMSEVQDEFSAVITKALMTLVHGLETKFDVEMAAMTRVLWGTLESVGDQSEYVNGINSILSTSIPVLGSLLSPIYFQFFLDKLAATLGPRFYLNIYKCKHISETGAQQVVLISIVFLTCVYDPESPSSEMLLDTQAVKKILLDIPSLGRQTSGAASYSKFVSREMSKAEALLKVILSPVDSVGDTYRALLPEGTTLEFQRILELKGLKKSDQQSILDDFSKHRSGITQPSVAPTQLPTAPAAPAAASFASAGAIGSREDVLTRAAALGRGAATTGFKRFLALTEAAKDRKDGPFRKLFNP
ncbi:hypothetical protein HHK36_001497 [Tetracentron sinense]|uniref:Uncharacterized protein n=1 Tax=Tetracentron sinense TaxID=13715 RepID=A0A835DV35_TETSI|nr:hypothetical protein HHK36_001497 [Tetracentron sinense]